MKMRSLTVAIAAIGVVSIGGASMTARHAAQVPSSMTNVEAADPFEDLVRPVLERRCLTCHNDQRRSGGFSVATHGSIIKGGNSGRTVVPGDAAGSELLRRIGLLPDDRQFMPADGKKTPLAVDEIRTLTWWIQSGAPTGVAVGRLDVPPDIKPVLAAVLASSRAVPAAASAGSTSAPASAVVRADAQLVEKLTQGGFHVRQLSRSNAMLIVSVGPGGNPLSSVQFTALTDAPDQIVELDLRRSGVRDRDLESISRLSRLTRLHLENNEVTDTGISTLAGVTGLEYLNLYGNMGITDASVDVLATIKSLKRLYIWNTGITAAGAARLAARRPDLLVNAGAR